MKAPIVTTIQSGTRRSASLPVTTATAITITSTTSTGAGSMTGTRAAGTPSETAHS